MAIHASGFYPLSGSEIPCQFYTEKSRVLLLCKELVDGMVVAGNGDEIREKAIQFLYESSLIDPTLPDLQDVISIYEQVPDLLRFYCVGVNECLQTERLTDQWREMFEYDQRNGVNFIEKPERPKLYLGLSEIA